MQFPAMKKRSAKIISSAGVVKYILRARGKYPGDRFARQLLKSLRGGRVWLQGHFKPYPGRGDMYLPGNYGKWNLHPYF